MNNESYWQKTTTLPHYPKLEQDRSYDIVIVGGGMSGITLAYRLNNSKFNVALFESDTLASKTTGHTTGKVTCLHDVICTDICKAYGEAKARAYFDSNNEALKEIKEIIRINKINCDFQENTAYVSANDKINCEKIEKQIKLFKSWQIDVIETMDKEVLMGLDKQVIFHPLKYLKALLEKCNNINIYEHSLVDKKIVLDNKVCLSINGYQVKTDIVIWMTRYPLNLQKGYFLRLLQEKEHVSYQEKITSKNSYINLTTNYSKRPLNNNTMLEINKNILNTSLYWYAQDSVSLRKIPYIGKINKHEYIAYGYNKWGMTLSHVASKLIYDLLMNNKNKYVSLYAPNYANYLYSKNDIIKLVKNNFHGIIKNRILVNKEVDLKENQGKVIFYKGHFIAIYRDKLNKYFYFSPYCPHLKCIIEFNEIDNTWNCPCHGSIFDCYGNLISTPATQNLKKYKKT